MRLMERLKRIVFSHKKSEVSVKEEAFLIIVNIGTLGSILAFIAGLFAGNVENLLTIGITSLLCISVIFACRKQQFIKPAMTILIALSGCVLFPMMFFLGGGIDSGIFVWMVLVFCIGATVLEGKTRNIVCTLILVIFLAAVYAGYAHPEYIKGSLDEKEFYYDTLVAFFAVIAAIAITSAYVIYRMEQINKDLVKAKEEAEIATQAKSIFLASMSHEIRTPLNAIVNLNEDITRMSDISLIKQNAEGVKYSARVLTDIVNDVLDFSKIEHGKYTIFEDEYESRELIAHFNMLGVDAIEKGIEYTVEESADKPLPEGLYGDEPRIKQIATKLVSNATKFTDKGSVTVNLEFIKDNEYSQEGMLKIAVADTGVGISKENLATIFEAFERTEYVKNVSNQGTGLGLTITKNFVNLMHGKIEVETEENVGSTFIVTIPQKIVKLDVEDEQEVYDFTGVRVLVCDDNKLNLKVFTKLLGSAKADIVALESGEQVIDSLKEEQFDVIFLDYQMPRMNGKECMQSIRELGVDTPIIVLTADTFDDYVLRYKNMGFDDFLAKPIDRMELYRKIKEYAFM